MRFSASRLHILASLAAVVAVMYPGLHDYLTTEVCLEIGIMDSSGVTSCPLGSVRMDVAAVRWFQVPTITSTALAFLAALIVCVFFSWRDHRASARTVA